MKLFTPVLAALLALTAGAGAARAAPAGACRMQTADAAWAQRAAAAWRLTEARLLEAAPRPRPRLVMFDQACVFQAPESYAAPRFTGRAHGGEIVLPDGARLPARVVSFASPYDHDRKAFFVMALPSIWQAQGVKSELGLETLMTAVMVHETTHTRQFYAFSPRMAALTAKWKLPDDINDDSLQERFAKDEAYVAAYKAERDLLFAAAAEPDLAKARAMAGQALDMVRARQARFFTGEDARWNDLDDTFLTLEGVAQYAAYRWLTDPHGAGLEATPALKAFRRGGRFWTQDEGLALFLLVDRLVPDWKAQAFAATPAGACELLAQAARR